MTLLEWVACEKEKECTSDYCTMVPDVILGFPFWKACMLHDWFYSCRVPLSMSDPLCRWKADCIFLIYLIEVVVDTVMDSLRSHPLLYVFLRGKPIWKI